MRNQLSKLGALLMLAMLSAGAQAAVCTTNAGAGTWGTAATWSCGHVPVAADTVVISRNITAAAATIAGLTVNAGITLTDGGNTLTITGGLTNNGIISGTGIMNVTGAASVVSGSGTFAGSRLYFSGAAPSIAAGSTLSFTGTSRLYAGRNAAGTTVATSVLTINGTINGSGQTGGTGTPWIRLYATNTIVSSTGVITATGTATIQFRAATLTNNGNVTIGTIVRNSGTGTWTNAANSSLTVNQLFSTTSMILNASAANNTVTFNTPATAITPSGNTYYNLAGTGVSCPTPYTILGTSPCVLPPGVMGVTRSPGTCANVTGIGTVAWGTPTSAYTSNNVYATLSVAKNVTTNYLQCTNYGFAIPAGSTIVGIAVNVERKTSGNTVRDAAMRIVRNVAGLPVIQAIDRSTLTNYTTTDVAEMHGSSTDLWGAAWTLADINTTNFGAAFAAKNVNSNARTASVDHMPITVYYSTPSIHHIEIDHPGSGSTCIPTNVTVKACGDAACNPANYYTLGASVTLTPGGNVVTIPIGSATGSGTVASGTAGTVVLAASSSPAAANATTCQNVVSGAASCSFTFNSGTISLAVPDGVSGTNVTGTILACIGGTPFQNVTRTFNFYTSYANPATGSKQATINSTAIGTTAATSTGISLNFNASSQATFTLAYPDVGRVTLTASYVGTPTLSNGVASFLMKPAGFVLSNIKQTAAPGTLNPGATDATGAAFVKAGEAFSVTVTAVNSAGATTPNFGQGTPPESVKLTPSLLAGLGLSNNPSVNRATTGSIALGSTTLTGVNSNGYAVGDRIRIVGAGVAGADLYATISAIPTVGAPGVITLAAAASTSVSVSTVHYAFGPFVSGVASGTNFTWDEVGIITLMPSIADGTYQTAGNVSGDVAGNPSGPVGRFTLGKFALQNVSFDDRADLNICNNGVLVSDRVTPCPLNFTYMGERADANFALVPKSLSGAAVHNYVDSATAANDFAKLDPTVFANLNLAAVDRATAGGPYYLSARISNAGMPAVSCVTAPLCFQSGTADVVASFLFSRNATADGAYSATDIGIAATDSDGARVEGVGATPGLCNHPNAADCYDLNTVNASAVNDHALIANTEFRYGRTNISNAYGSELLGLVLPVAIEYWNGGVYVKSADDVGTVLTIAQDNTPPNLSAGKTISIMSAIVNGVGQISFTAPNMVGSVTVSATSPSYLPSNAGRATFGVYKGPFIYMREQY